MTCDRSAFKAYDIRGTYPTIIDEEGARAIGAAFVQHLGATKLAVGRDMRTMAPSVAKALIEGITSAGADVIDIGQVATEMLYHAVASHELDGGIMVTASHNPAQDIGMKCVRKGAQPVGLDSGLDKVRDLALAIHDGQQVHGEPSGSVSQLDISASFQELVASFIDASKIRELTVVIDAGNGMGAEVARPLLDQLPITIHAYHDDPDGTFPHHEPNPLLPENREFLIDAVKRHNADLGIAWDGDADRCFFVDDKGEFVPGDFITALLAQEALKAEPASKVLYDLRASRAVPDTVKIAGGEAIASRVGHAYIKQRLRAENAVFAGEVSGHYYFKRYHGVDTGVIPALLMLQLISIGGEPLSLMVQELRDKYFISGEINSTVDDIPVKLQQLKETYADAEISHLDGISVDYPSWHFNVRPSNTEPLLRLNLESLESYEDMEAKRDEVLGLIRSPSAERIGHH